MTNQYDLNRLDSIGDAVALLRAENREDWEGGNAILDNTTNLVGITRTVVELFDCFINGIGQRKEAERLFDVALTKALADAGHPHEQAP